MSRSGHPLPGDGKALSILLSITLNGCFAMAESVVTFSRKNWR